MGSATLKLLLRRTNIFHIRILSRPGKKARKKLSDAIADPSVEIIWGDLRNKEDVKRAMGEADIVLHIGGMVSPMADHYPKMTMDVNVSGARNIVEAIKERPDANDVHAVYIGSVAQTAHHMEPHHWGRTGDPVITGIYDHYGVSKIKAELIFAESGLKHWVSLRQSGILHKDLIYRGTDPITFHVPLRGVLEWSTVEDSARLMLRICESIANKDEAYGHFWRRFYNIGSGREFRLTNYEFEVLLLKALGCPPPEKIFEPWWFATRNFHGEWYEDSDKLEDMFHFREKIPAEDYFKRMASSMPWWMKLTPLAPAFLIKGAMKALAHKKGQGTLDWLSNSKMKAKATAYFGPEEKRGDKKDWKHQDLSRPSNTPLRISHGYDESKPESELELEDMHQAAKFRGGKCVSEEMKKGDLDTPLEWECAFGHRFSMTPRSVLLGGHWCPECLPTPWRYDAEAKKNSFMAQIWHDTFDTAEDNEY